MEVQVASAGRRMVTVGEGGASPSKRPRIIDMVFFSPSDILADVFENTVSKVGEEEEDEGEEGNDSAPLPPPLSETSTAASSAIASPSPSAGPSTSPSVGLSTSSSADKSPIKMELEESQFDEVDNQIFRHRLNAGPAAPPAASNNAVFLDLGKPPHEGLEDVVIDEHLSSKSPVAEAPEVVPIFYTAKREPVTLQIGDLCVFSCKFCPEEHTSWGKMYQHIERSHQEYTDKIVKSEWIAKRVLHQCQVCNRNLNCERRAVSVHVFNHQMTLKEYIEKFPDVREEVTVERTSDPVTDRVGNLCTYRCILCYGDDSSSSHSQQQQQVCSSWESMYYHIKNRHADYKKKIARKDWMLSRVLHRCRLCGQTVDCDRRAIKIHLKYHDVTLGDYVARLDRGGGGSIEGAKKQEGEGVAKSKPPVIKEEFTDPFRPSPVFPTKRAANQAVVLANSASPALVQVVKEEPADPGEVVAANLDGEAPVSLVVGDLCVFSCKFCPYTLSCWLKMYRHVEIKHQQYDSRIVKKDFLSKVVLHECQVCLKKIYCERKAICSHMNQRHKLTLQEYIDRFPQVIEEETSDSVEEHPVTGQVANLCEYTCQMCQVQHNSWEHMYSHIKKDHPGFRRKISRHDWMSRKVLHQCHVCRRTVDCDRRAIKAHVYYHQLSLQEYASKYCEEQKTEQKTKPNGSSNSRTPKIESKVNGSAQTSSTEDDLMAAAVLSSLSEGAVKIKTEPLEADDIVAATFRRILPVPAKPAPSKPVSPTPASPMPRSSITQIDGDKDLSGLYKVGDLCEFSCKFCPLKSSTWQKLHRHLEIKHQDYDSKIVKSDFMTKVVWHQCQVCEKLIYCERKAIAAHINRHQLTIQRYIDQHAILTEVQAEAAETPNVEVTGEVGNQCEYACLLCRQPFGSWEQTYNHLKRKHEDYHGKIDRQDWMTKKVLHSCLVCAQRVDCDHKAIKGHVYYHGLSLNQYMALAAEPKKEEPVCGPDGGEVGLSQMYPEVKLEKESTPSPTSGGHDVDCDDEADGLVIAEEEDDEEEETDNYQQAVEEQEEEGDPLDGTVSQEDGKIISTLVGDLCVFQCKLCPPGESNPTYKVWQKLYRHVEVKHQEYTQKILKKDFAVRTVWHRCQACSKTVYCERKAIGVHINQRHKLTLTDYVAAFPALKEVQPVHGRGVKITDSTESLCWYSCRECHAYKSNLWDSVLKHVRSEHPQRAAMIGRDVHRKDWMTRRVLHRCRVCSKSMDCDRRVITLHVNRHGMTLQQYEEDHAAGVRPQQQLENGDSAAAASEVGTVQDDEEDEYMDGDSGQHDYA